MSSNSHKNKARNQPIIGSVGHHRGTRWFLAARAP